MILRRFFLYSLVGFVLAGCGLKGPLYLPESKEQQDSAVTTEEQQKRERATNGSSPTPPAPTDSVQTPPPGN